MLVFADGDKTGISNDVVGASRKILEFFESRFRFVICFLKI